MQQQFLKKFFPSHWTNSFKRQIITFTQKPGEKKFFPSHRTNSFKRQITTFTQKPGEKKVFLVSQNKLF
jgi:isopentenyldiphosphate isomerase